MERKDDPQQEGHTREWADRARVELNASEEVKKSASPKQSPDSETENKDDQAPRIKNNRNEETVY